MLNILDLSYNNLSGNISILGIGHFSKQFIRIPQFVDKWGSLEFLDLSFNDFEGEVPIVGVFANTSAFSVVGNNRLCGGLDTLELPKCKETDLLPSKFYIFKVGLLTEVFLENVKPWRNIRHRNLLKIITSCSSVDFQGNDFKALVYEYMPNGSVHHWLHSSADTLKLNLLQRVNILNDVPTALDYLHNRCQTTIVHGDLKPSNILLVDDMVSMVSGVLSIHKFASMALPDHVTDVIDDDAIVLQSTEANAKKVEECLVAITKIGVSCSVDSPLQRMKTEIVVTELQNILNVLQNI
ncbi:kinase-like domain-containing protein [Tanacetum coccineum]|uniref:Kinase-like domain-containing protein n=1 Tax=Tanacetum coccineum TaxID=301880 RepID=A0ABQ4ZYF3_9ASTR